MYRTECKKSLLRKSRILQYQLQHGTCRGHTLCLLLVLALTACAPAPERPVETVDTPGREEPEPSLHLPERSLPGYMQQFQPVDQALEQHDWMTAYKTLRELEDFSDEEEDYRLFAEARIAVLRGRTTEADILLQSLEDRAIDPRLRNKITVYQRERATRAREYLKSARLGNRLLAVAEEDSDRLALIDSIWHDLRRSDRARVNRELRSASEPQWRGWLELARIYLEAGAPETRAARLRSWRTRHQQHAAAQTAMPAELRETADTPAPPPQHVALLLPFSGPLRSASEAVRDGYLSRYYQYNDTLSRTAEITVMDQADFSSSGSAYQAAVTNGNELVIGPLDRGAVEAVAALPGREIPVMALNSPARSPIQPATGLDFIHMALSPEQEIRAIANLAWAEGARSALLLRPAGEWGNRLEIALRENWSALGGEITARASYTSPNEYSDNVRQALGLDLSEQRATALRRVIGENIELTPRRRQDVDVVFLLSRNPREASALNPLLAFHYAGDLPVFSLSAIHDPRSERTPRDLDGINIVQMPGLIRKSANTVQGLDTVPGSARLYALGADAYELQQQLPKLLRGRDIQVSGASGLLTVDRNGQVHREMTWARFDEGALIPR